MKKSCFKVSQIVKILKEVESGRMVKEVCREYSIAESTYYTWKSKYGGMEVTDVMRLIIEIDLSLPSQRVIRTLERVIAW